MAPLWAPFSLLCCRRKCESLFKYTDLIFVLETRSEKVYSEFEYYMNKMTGRRDVFLALICALCLKVCQAVKVGNVLIQSQFYQTQLPSAEFAFQFDDDEIFNVDFDNKAVRWRLPQFGEVASYDTAGALQNKAVMTENLKNWIKRSNYTASKPVTPSIQVFTEDPVVLNEPNKLICFVKRIFPPIMKMSWMKNNQPVTVGVSETDFYFASDSSYYKFLYLASIIKEDDVYTCSVEHAGLPKDHTNKMWSPDIPSHVSETSENVVCGLGLAIGIIGIIAGIFLIFKGIKNNQNRGH
ncbi:H-2 class II histocompatibility antigen, A-Q alpha chain-like isoform 2-T2 [Anomaloglossus baeobatrachus]|uniref:H-2 class II histocompatibility antigen, A-Q alpha chain-like isoform X2 n=1 Tax=Anomaloglossus baeobatrachus TaxID=238106 RepID=UPI003F50735B